MNAATSGFATAIFAVFAAWIGFSSQQQPSTLAPETLLSVKNPSVEFTGEVSQGKLFERPVAENLIFRLSPQRAPENGWYIEIVPKVPPPPGQDAEFTWVATPPYHFFNQRYLDTSYSTTAAQAVAMNARDFNFVRTLDDYCMAAEAVNMVIYPNNATGQEMDRVRKDAARVTTGSGTLYILDSRITPGKDDKDMGSIDWIRFKVDLKWSSGENMAQILDLEHAPAKMK